MINILVLLLTSTFSIQHSELRSVFRASSALPAHVAGAFEEIAGCHVSPEGDYLVFDRRGHAVYRVPRDGEGGARKILQIGIEPGRILSPIAFASASDGTYVVADAPGGQERIQIFSYLGASFGGFYLPVRSVPRVTLGDVVLSGVGSVDYTGKAILIAQPDIVGALVTEYGPDGRTLKTFGELRKTGHEAERDLHLALNGGLPLAIPGGGYYYVFVAGVPAFRKYGAKGELIFERHIEGTEIDEHLRALPSTWPRRKTQSGEFPLVPSAIRTAAVSPDGSLWISLISPHSYVYDPSGDKRRVVQFQGGGGIFGPNDLFFTKEGRLLTSPGCYLFNVN